MTHDFHHLLHVMLQTVHSDHIVKSHSCFSDRFESVRTDELPEHNEYRTEEYHIEENIHYHGENLRAVSFHGHRNIVF